jgi:hypothetical protein
VTRSSSLTRGTVSVTRCIHTLRRKDASEDTRAPLQTCGARTRAYHLPAPARCTTMRPAADRQGCRSRALTSALAVLFGSLELSCGQRVSCQTTKGVLNIMLHRDWAPEGHARFMELLDSDFFSDQVFYGVERREWIQFGIPADPAVSRAWRGKVIADDPERPELQARRGQLSFQADQHGRRETRLVISDSRTRTAADYGPFERPFGQVVSAHSINAQCS